jgi:carbon monoxide dehydrogenase subunit G
MNIQEIAPCFPGVELTEYIDENIQKGRIKVKLGPVSMVFVGTLEFKNKDDKNLRANVSANWREEKGRGSAQSDIQFQLIACDQGTLVNIESEVQLAGQVAQYGRGVGMIAEISNQLISKFASNLEQKSKDYRPSIDSSKISSLEVNASIDRTVNSAISSSNEISALGLLWRVLLQRIKALFQKH